MEWIDPDWDYDHVIQYLFKDVVRIYERTARKQQEHEGRAVTLWGRIPLERLTLIVFLVEPNSLPDKIPVIPDWYSQRLESICYRSALHYLLELSDDHMETPSAEDLLTNHCTGDLFKTKEYHTADQAAVDCIKEWEYREWREAERKQTLLHSSLDNVLGSHYTLYLWLRSDADHSRFATPPISKAEELLTRLDAVSHASTLPLYRKPLIPDDRFLCFMPDQLGHKLLREEESLRGEASGICSPPLLPFTAPDYLRHTITLQADSIHGVLGLRRTPGGDSRERKQPQKLVLNRSRSAREKISNDFDYIFIVSFKVVNDRWRGAVEGYSSPKCTEQRLNQAHQAHLMDDFQEEQAFRDGKHTESHGDEECSVYEQSQTAARSHGEEGSRHDSGAVVDHRVYPSSDIEGERRHFPTWSPLESTCSSGSQNSINQSVVRPFHGVESHHNCRSGVADGLDHHGAVPQLQATCTRMRNLLQRIQLWTIRTGDTSTLQSLSANIHNLTHAQGLTPFQTGEQTSFQRSSGSGTQGGYGPSSTSNDFHSSDQNHRSRLRNGAVEDHSGPQVKNGHWPQVKNPRLRCPCYFIQGQTGCNRLMKNVRDIIRHLQCHGLFFCPDCSRRWLGREQLKSHSCDRVCIDLNCVNYQTGKSYHDHHSGCVFSFKRLNTRAKWYALFKLMLPETDLPSWDDVCVTIEEDSEDMAEGNQQPIDDTRLPILAPQPFVNIHVQPAGVSSDINDPTAEGDSSIDRNEVRNMAEEVLSLFAQMTTVIKTNQEQNRYILRQDQTISTQSERLAQQEDTITQQNQRLSQQESIISTLQRQMQEFQNQIAYLNRHLLSNAMQNQRQQSDSDDSDALMQCDSHEDSTSHQRPWDFDGDSRVDPGGQWELEQALQELDWSAKGSVRLI